MPNPLPIGPADRLRYLALRARGEASSRLRRATAGLFPRWDPGEIAVLGAFHGRNVGDMALGQSVLAALGERPARLFDIHRLREEGAGSPQSGGAA
ncbi:hypothetical protein, partial [Alienimonas chondri]|uniref:hypothetical protein n=1 Tax=Alienimonas chondri TaxID=2681879 RepID=UPI0014887C60